MSYIDSQGNTKVPSPCSPSCGCEATSASMNVPLTGGIAFGNVAGGAEGVKKYFSGEASPLLPGETLLIRAPSTTDDNWKHRSPGMLCRTCISFVAKATSPGPHPPLDARGRLGRCRKHAPTISGFPAVFDSDWCGDHRLDEEKSNG